MSEAVQLSLPEPGIVVVKIEDRDARNTFSRAVMEGLTRAFETIRSEAQARVVVIHGYENYFCCGGTRDELMKLHRGEVEFTDFPFYRLLLDCELPTISAMQGHAIGGGLAFGLYADMLVLAEESLYSANFMRYGFTPGMGSTYIVPLKFGPCLGAEMLFSAAAYHGGQLKERGLTARVVKKKDVIPTALALARELADRPLLSLKLLKQQLAQPIRDSLPAWIEREVAMHRLSFRQPEVKDRIEKLFGN
ncbi:MAG: enoyl-CoA hydratase/isomerase family protein [Verrucomicrobia bacterium]|nr:enoyl-CoA hydratase/isomerase family protein [Verrucomicrobiota bacterium]